MITYRFHLNIYACVYAFEPAKRVNGHDYAGDEAEKKILIVYDVAFDSVDSRMDHDNAMNDIKGMPGKQPFFWKQVLGIRAKYLVV